MSQFHDHSASAAASGPLVPRPAVVHAELENGLQVLVLSDYTAPVVSIQYWCATGSIHEGRWLGSGISHLLEHLMFKGTPTRGNSQMARQIHDLGGHLNAYTSFDRTVYHVDLPAENWRPALDILTDAVTSSTLPEEEFEKEKEVIRREFAMGKDDPDRELGKLVFSTVFVRHPYRFPVIGHLDLFNQLTRQDVLDYYQQRYSVQNLTLIVCGAVEADALIEEARRRCGHIPRRPLPDIFLPDEPPQQAPRREMRVFPTQLTRLAVTYPIPGLHDDDIPALDVLAMLLGDGRSSRLYQSAVEKRGLAEELEAFTYAPAQHGVWGVDARCKPENRDALLAHLAEEIMRCKAEPPRPEEVERARRLSILGQLRSLKSMSGKAASIGRGWLLDRDPHFSSHYLEKLGAVTPDDVQRVARCHLAPSTENLVVLEGHSAAIVPGLASATVAPKAEVEKLEILPGLRGLTLVSNDLPLAALRATLPGGLLQEPLGKAGLNRLVSQMLIKGTRRRSAEALALEIENLGGTFGADSGNNSATCALELLAQDWQRGLEILAEILTECQFTEAELATEKRKQVSDIHAELDHPMAVARNLTRAALYPSHPYANPVLGTEESLAGITLEDAVQHAQRAFLHRGLILSSAGAIDTDAFRESAASLLAALPAPEAAGVPQVPPALVASPWRVLTEPVRIEHLVKKEQAVIQVAFPTAPLTHPDMLPLAVLDDALSDLGSRLFVRIREELGLAYFVGTSQFLSLAGGYFFFYVGTDPDKRLTVESALLQEINTVATRGIEPAELDRARAKLLSQEKLQAQNPSHVVYSASLDELYGLGYSFAHSRRRRLAALELDEVNATAARYFSKPGYVLTTVTPR